MRWAAVTHEGIQKITLLYPKLWQDLGMGACGGNGGDHDG